MRDLRRNNFGLLAANYGNWKAIIMDLYNEAATERHEMLNYYEKPCYGCTNCVGEVTSHQEATQQNCNMESEDSGDEPAKRMSIEELLDSSDDEEEHIYYNTDHEETDGTPKTPITQIDDMGMPVEEPPPYGTLQLTADVNVDHDQAMEVEQAVASIL